MKKICQFGGFTIISCTEFIPSYSELFSYLDENLGGHAEVERFWTYLFEPTGKGIPLINLAKKDGLRGCWNYWMGTLTVQIAYCPAVKHLHETGRDVSPFFRYATEYVMETLAQEIGLSFVMDAYDEESGKAAYHFTKA